MSPVSFNTAGVEISLHAFMGSPVGYALPLAEFVVSVPDAKLTAAPRVSDELENLKRYIERIAARDAFDKAINT